VTPGNGGLQSYGSSNNIYGSLVVALGINADSVTCTNLNVTGSKNSLQKTESYGERLINAYETAEYYFADMGYGQLNENGELTIHIDEIFQECVNIDIPYHVFIQNYNGRITSIVRDIGYFNVYGNPGTEFSWEIKAKRKGYENNRLESPDGLETPQNSDIESELGGYVQCSDVENDLNIIVNLENILLEV
jgi:hypothetical protein